MTMCRYVAFLKEEGLSASSIRGYLSAIRHLHIEEGWGDPSLSSMPKLELVIRGGEEGAGKLRSIKTQTADHPRPAAKTEVDLASQ